MLKIYLIFIIVNYLYYIENLIVESPNRRRIIHRGSNSKAKDNKENKCLSKNVKILKLIINKSFFYKKNQEMFHYYGVNVMQRFH